MGLFEKFTHKEEIKTLLDEAQQRYDASSKKFRSQKKSTAQSLEKLGKIKIDSWASCMETFVEAFSSFKNIEIDMQIETNLHFFGADEESQQMIINIKQASMTATEIAKAGFAAVGTGALVGIASYGGAMMFASASTGTAINLLSGAAKKNATLAWFGGGSIKSGGRGIAGGKIVLAGIVLVPALLVGTLITSIKGKEKLAEAKKIHAEALDASSKMDLISTGMHTIAKMADNYSSFIRRFDKKFAPFVQELMRIKEEHISAQGEKIDFNSLAFVEKKTLHISWLMAQIYYKVLSTSILTNEGEVSKEADATLSASNSSLKQLKKDTFRMKDDEAAIGDIFWGSSAKKMLVLNFIAVALLLLLGIMALGQSIIMGITYFSSAVIAMPIFFKFRNLPASKLYFWRLARLVIAGLLVIVVRILVR